MISIEDIKNIVFDWCDMVLNQAVVVIGQNELSEDITLDGSRILPTSLDMPIEPSHDNEAAHDKPYIVINYTPNTFTSLGIDPMNTGVATDYDPDTEEWTYSQTTDYTDTNCLMEVREVNGSGKALQILNKLKDHPMVKELFNSRAMVFRGIEGSIQSIPFETKNSFHLESVMTVKLGLMDEITYNAEFFNGVEGDYELKNEADETISTGTYNTDNIGE